MHFNTLFFPFPYLSVMRLFHKSLIFCVLLLTSYQVKAQCDTSALIVQQVWANQTDNNIPGELYRHYTFYNPDCTPKNVLLVHLVGTKGKPYQTIYFPSLAANNGFHVLSLKYHNDTSAQTQCNLNADVDCHYKFRREIIEGVDVSPETTVDSVNSINNRLLRLIQYMDVNNPAQGWGQYYTGNDINWEKLMLSGHSQGGGHAAVMAIDRPVQRVLMFASPNDYSTTYSQTAPWTSMAHAAADSAYYSFNNTNDLVAQYNWQYTAALNLGEGAFGDTVDVEMNACPYQYTHNLYTSRDTTGLLADHGMVVNDVNVPLDGSGTPVFEDVWRYMLGLPCATMDVNEIGSSSMTIAPNPFNDILTISFHTGQHRTIRMTALDGVCVYTSSSNSTSHTLNVSHLPAGTYILTATDEQGKSLNLRVVK